MEEKTKRENAADKKTTGMLSAKIFLRRSHAGAIQRTG